MKKTAMILTSLSVIGLAACSSTSAKFFSIRVLDDNGSPVSGVMVQLCDDSLCRRAGFTDDNGFLSTKDAEIPMGTYAIHLDRIPSSLTFNPNAYELSKKKTSVTINLVSFEAYSDDTAASPIEVTSGIKRLSFSSSLQRHYLHVDSAIRLTTWSEESVANPMALIPSLTVYNGSSFEDIVTTHSHPEGKKNIEVELAADSYFTIDVDNARSMNALDFEVVLA